jgi:hypothetical protein
MDKETLRKIDLTAKGEELFKLLSECKITYVTGDDWEAMFVDGVLLEEGHRIDRDVLLDRLFPNCEYKEADMEWLERRGNFPEKLKDVRLED